MADDRVLFDEIHIQLLASRRMTAEQGSSAQRTITSRVFQGRLRSAIRALVREFQALKSFTVTIDR